MAGIQCYLKELDRQRDKLANILTAKGIESDESEKYNSLVEKVAQIETGGSKAYTSSAVANGSIGSSGYAELVNVFEHGLFEN